MKRKILKVLLTLFFFVLIANICSAQNSARGIVAEKTLGLKVLMNLKFGLKIYWVLIVS